MYELKVARRFAAAHNLKNFHGKCEDLHGHNWLVEVHVQSPGLDQAGLVMDFGEIKKHLDEVLELLDHKYLNDIDYFKENNTSSEHIARFIYEQIRPKIESGPVRVTKVSAWESENARASYMP
jgi:6-pyruvoyltetrahydropterin/6-carboxytetrahydropterin synthase